MRKSDDNVISTCAAAVSYTHLLVGEDKMSKSKGNVIYADDLVEYFGVDAVQMCIRDRKR